MRESERGERNTKGDWDGATICGYGRHPMAKLAGETMARGKYQALH